MGKFRCTQCNEAIELNQSRGFKMKDHHCKCGGSIESVFHCTLHGVSPERIKTTINNTHINTFTGKPYYNAWRNKRHFVYIIDINNKLVELTFAEHNNFDFSN